MLETERGIGIGMALGLKHNFLCFAKVYYHNIMLSLVLYIGEFCCHTDI